MSNADYRRLLFTLGILSALTFSAILAIYAFISSNHLSSRLVFALFTSILPSLLALALFRVMRLRVSRWRVVAAYFGLLILVQVLMEELR